MAKRIVRKAVELGPNIGEAIAMAAILKQGSETISISETQPPAEPVVVVEPTVAEPTVAVAAPTVAVAEPVAVAVAESVAVAEPVVEPARPVRPAVTTRFVGWYAVKPSEQPADGVLINATPQTGMEPVHGVILIGPRANQEFALESVQAHRFVVNHGEVAVENAGAPIRRKPSISPAQYVRLACGGCGMTELILKHRQFSPEFRAKWSPSGESCRCPGCGGRVMRQYLENTLTGGSGVPVFGSPSDPILGKFGEDYSSSRRDGSYKDMLPRLWAVYPARQTPFDWSPKDGLAREISRRAAQNGMSIRPFKAAYASRSPHILFVGCEVSYSLVTGWINEADLNQYNLEPKMDRIGWNRNFGFRPEMKGF